MQVRQGLLDGKASERKHIWRGYTNTARSCAGMRNVGKSYAGASIAMPAATLLVWHIDITEGIACYHMVRSVLDYISNMAGNLPLAVASSLSVALSAIPTIGDICQSKQQRTSVVCADSGRYVRVSRDSRYGPILIASVDGVAWASKQALRLPVETRIYVKYISIPITGRGSSPWHHVCSPPARLAICRYMPMALGLDDKLMESIMLSSIAWRAKARQWLRVARRKTADERAAALRAAIYCRAMSMQTRQPIKRAIAC